MKSEKVVNCKYTLDTDEINGLKQTKVILQGICNLFDHECQDCPLKDSCMGLCDFDALINDTINNSNKLYCHEE